MNLGYSPAWWNRPGIMRARYEDLVATQEETFGRLVEQIGGPPRLPLAQTLDEMSIRRIKVDQSVWHFHYWQGQPGLWRSFFPPDEARALAAAHADTFEILGYACDPDESLDGARADHNWIQLQLDSTREHLRIERANHRRTKSEIHMLKLRTDEITRSLEAAQETQAETSLAVAATCVDERDRTEPVAETSSPAETRAASEVESAPRASIRLFGLPIAGTILRSLRRRDSAA